MIHSNDIISEFIKETCFIESHFQLWCSTDESTINLFFCFFIFFAFFLIKSRDNFLLCTLSITHCFSAPSKGWRFNYSISWTFDQFEHFGTLSLFLFFNSRFRHWLFWMIIFYSLVNFIKNVWCVFEKETAVFCNNIIFQKMIFLLYCGHMTNKCVYSC